MYALKNTSSTTLRIFKAVGTLEFVKKSLQEAASNALNKAYLAKMKCVVVSKAFKNASEEQTKFKQIEHQLKESGFDYAGQMVDALNNACWVLDYFRRSRRT